MPPGWGDLIAQLPNVSGWVAFGILAILVIVALMVGKLVPGYIYQAALDNAKRYEVRLDAEKAKDEAAAAAAAVAEQAALRVVDQLERAQRTGRTAASRQRARARTDESL